MPLGGMFTDSFSPVSDGHVFALTWRDLHATAVPRMRGEPTALSDGRITSWESQTQERSLSEHSRTLIAVARTAAKRAETVIPQQVNYVIVCGLACLAPVRRILIRLRLPADNLTDRIRKCVRAPMKLLTGRKRRLPAQVRPPRSLSHSRHIAPCGVTIACPICSHWHSARVPTPSAPHRVA